jgi:two-component system response regulator NreC
MSYNIVIADDHWMIRDGIKTAIIQENKDFHVAGEAKDGRELLEILKSSQPDLVILDISMPGMSGLEAAKQIRSLYPHVKILVLTMYEDSEFLDHALAARVNGYLTKTDSDEELISAIQEIRQDKLYISPRML